MADGFTWAYGMVLAASLLPIVSAGIAKKIGARDSGGFDNRVPGWSSSEGPQRGPMQPSRTALRYCRSSSARC